MRILLADDDTRVGKRTRQALIAEGYAQDGDEALWLLFGRDSNQLDAALFRLALEIEKGSGEPGITGSPKRPCRFETSLT